MEAIYFKCNRVSHAANVMISSPRRTYNVVLSVHAIRHQSTLWDHDLDIRDRLTRTLKDERSSPLNANNRIVSVDICSRERLKSAVGNKYFN